MIGPVLRRLAELVDPTPDVPDATTTVWRDAFSATDSWIQFDVADPDDEVLVESSGWVLPGMKDGYVVIASCRFERDGSWFYGGLTYIPEGMIV